VGDRIFRPGTADAVHSDYHGGIGDMRLDLSVVDVSDLDTPIRTHVDAGVGDVTIIVPRDADVRVDIDSGIGSVEVFDEDGRSDGFFEGEGSGAWVGDDEPEIVLSVNAGIGDVEVDRA
jgi:predicted membrane protein